MGKNKKRFGNDDFKKLGPMIRKLEEIKVEMIPEENDKEEEERKKRELKKLDPWERKKLELNTKLAKLRQDVGDLQDIRAKMGQDHRDKVVIKLQVANSRLLKECKDGLAELVRLLDKAANRRFKKIPPNVLEQRYQATEQFGNEVVDLGRKNAKTGDTSGLDNAIVARVTRNRVEQKREERRQKREQRTKNRRKRRGEAEEVGEVVQMSEQEQIFMDKVEANVQEQNELLDQLSATMDTLHQLGTDMNKEIKKQGKMIDELDVDLDRNMEKLKTGNQKLKEILKESGGMNKWCPYLCCAVLLLGMVGYIWNVVGG